MSVLLVTLSLVIGGYTYLTDSNRVRTMAQGYLSHLLGGRVEIGGATLSIFEGLRVDDVKVHVDPDRGKPDSLLFSAQAFVVNYDPRKLIRGQLDATEIVAQKPHVYLTLTQQPGGDQWNYQRFGRNQPPQPEAAKGPTTLTLPSVLLRNAVVEISEVKAGKRYKMGSIDIDGQLTPAGDGEHYQFQMQSRGISEGLGPWANGTIATKTGDLSAHLRNVEFSDDFRSMFPADLRDWWERHELSGKVESVDLFYAPARNGGKARFSVRTTVRGITLAVHREEWSSHEEVLRWQRLRDGIALLDGAYRLAGYATSAAEVGSSDSPIAAILDMSDTAPVRLREVTGSFNFNQDRIDVDGLLVRVGTGDADNPGASNALIASGHIDGYSPDAPAHMEVRSTDPNGMYFPNHPRFVDSLPADVRQIFNDLRPQGSCRVTATVDRLNPGEAPRIGVEAEIVDASFFFHEFPYAFQGATGKVVFRRDPFSGKSYVYVTDMHAHGTAGGPNAQALISVSGRVGPIGPEYPEPGFEMRATGTHVRSEPALLAAMPPDVRIALKTFDAPGKGQYPQFLGNFVCDLNRPPGKHQRVDFVCDIDIQDAAGRVVGFPILLRHAHGKVQVHDGYADVLGVTAGEGATRATVSGRVRWAEAKTFRNQPLDLDLKVSVRNMPLNDELVAAVPPEDAVWLKKLGLGGVLDCDGKIFTVVPNDWHQKIKPSEKAPDPPVLFDLNIGVHDGTIWPADGMFSLSAVAGKLHLTHDSLELIELTGRREAAELAASGKFTFGSAAPTIALHVTARNLTLDRPLYAMLPVEGRSAWDEVRPEGTVDAEIDYNGALGAEQPTAIASAAPIIELPRLAPDQFRAVLHPKKLAVKVRTVPYPIMFTGGTVDIAPGHAVLKELVGSHGPAKLSVSGEGNLGAAAVWNLTLQGQDIRPDDEFHKAMPPLLRDIFNALKLNGSIGFDFSKLSYRAASTPDGDPDIDVEGTVSLKDGSADAGMPMTAIQGGMKFTAATRRGTFDGLNASLAFESLNLGGRPVHDLRLDLSRAAGQTDLHVDHLRASVAGGEVGGSAVLSFPDQGPGHYTMNLAVRDASVKALTGESDPNIRGELTASLALEGKWDDPSARRGRGDVVVAGKQLYRIPLMLGLLQVTNLSLPIGQPFTRGTARYNVEGTRVNFEQMDLRADAMMMSGTGYLDFGTKQVRLNLTTDNPAGFKIPFITDLWRGARQELLRITVEGTVQDPKVQPSTMGVITTTIDQVFKGDAPHGK